MCSVTYCQQATHKKFLAMSGDSFAVSFIARQDSKVNTVRLRACHEKECRFMPRLILLTRRHRRTLERGQIQ
jgi:hypothetical protein